MSESLEDLKAIIDNSPDGATHYDEDDDYVKFICDEMYHYSFVQGYGWSSDYASPCELRSLSDIKRIIELMERVKAGYEAYTRIESVKQKYNAENKQMKVLLKDIIENEDLDDDRYLAVSMVLEGE